MEPRELYYSLSKASREVLDEFHLKGLLLKKVSADIQEHLDGVLSGLVAETHEDESVTVYSLDIEEKGDFIRPLLKWDHGEVKMMSKKGRRASASYVVPEGKGLGVYLDKKDRVFVPLRA